MRELKELEKRIGYHFQNPELLEKALRHSSYANEHKMNRIECNERLEFLGDAVLELGSFLRLGKGEEMTGGRHRDSVTSDALESVIGAVYLDGGFANAKEFVLKYVLNDMEHKKLFFDSKTIFQEMVQGNIPGEISYHPLGESGPDHDKTFSVEVWIGEQCMGQGSGRTKKAAEQMAAYRAICRLKATDNKQKQ